MSLGRFISVLKDAVFVSIPHHRNTKIIKNGIKRVWNHEISGALKACKVAWWQWREAGEPSSKNHPLVIRMKQSKRLLRKSQRQAEAKRTSDKVERIMSSEGSDKEFYRLVKYQRKTSDAPYSSSVLKEGYWRPLMTYATDGLPILVSLQHH